MVFFLMNNPFTIVSFGLERWHTPWLNRQHILSEMSRHVNVFYSNQERTIGDNQSTLQGRQNISSSLYIHTPSMALPNFFNPLLLRLNPFMRRLRIQEIKQILQKKHWITPIVNYIWHPHFADLLGELNECVSVFHCHDYYPEFMQGKQSDVDPLIKNMELALNKADLVFVSSSAIGIKMQEHVKREYTVIENGVNFSLFHRGASLPLPAELADIPHPIMGYIGRINCKIDFKLLLAIARARPDFSVLLMGPLAGELPSDLQAMFDTLRALPNFFYIPEKSPADLPPYFNAIDVGIMPYRLATWAQYGFPLKLFEYFAVGKPCVCSPLSSIKMYYPAVLFALTLAEWLEAIDKALVEKDQKFSVERIKCAEKNTWAARVEQIFSQIQKTIEYKKKQGQCIR